MIQFRGVIRDPQYMRELQGIILTLNKLSRSCVMNLSNDRVYFVANEESTDTAPLIWIDIDAKLYFSEYLMKSAQAEYPHIMLQISTINMAHTFGQMRNYNIRYCKMKLTNVQFPCLSVQMEVKPPNSDTPRQVVHTIPVTIIPRVDWCYYELPQVPKCKLVLMMPLKRWVRNIMERFKNLSPTMIIYATSKGELNFVSETEMVTITTSCTKLTVRDINETAEDRGKDVITASCSVDCKKALQFVNALQLPTNELACGIDDERLIHLELLVREGVTVHSILPAVCM